MGLLLVSDSIKDIAQFLTLLVIFIFVLAITYFTTRFIGNYQKQQTINSNIKLHEAARLSQNKYIQIVQVGKRFFAIAVCKDSVQVIAELAEDDIDLEKNQGVAVKSFSDILGYMKNKPSQDDTKKDNDEDIE